MPGQKLPRRECDIVMKGGVTSGIVYPPALLELQETYRFNSIGGTSAGAVAGLSPNRPTATATTAAMSATSAASRTRERRAR